MRVDDLTGQLTENEKQELETFVHKDLLSTELDIDWLDIIKIQENGLNNSGGSWRGGLIYDQDNEIIGFGAVIILNYSYVKIFKNNPKKRLDKLKEVLAHEYGHHWTLSYLLVKKIIGNFADERLPQKYYKLRGLNKRKYTSYPASPSFDSWCLCDKEVIAEDYRILFASTPYNQNHKMVLHSKLAAPNEDIKNYIKNLPSIQEITEKGFIAKLKGLISKLMKFG